MAPTLVKPLVNLRSQLNTRFSDRDKASDGWIGDYQHQTGTSGHNPDDTAGGGNAEWEGDADSVQDVRAIDVDKDLRDVYGWTMERFIQWFIGRLREGEFQNIRYVIFNKRIWHRRDGFATHEYTGSNPHDKHAHFSNDWSEADDDANTNYRLERTVPDLSAEDVQAINAHTTAQANRIISEVNQVDEEVWAFELYNPFNQQMQPAGTLLRYIGSRQGHLDTQGLLEAARTAREAYEASENETDQNLVTRLTQLEALIQGLIGLHTPEPSSIDG